MREASDFQRMIGDVVRLCIVASVDHATQTCQVTIGPIRTGDLPWLTGRAGRVRIWSPPSIGEQALLICPESDTAAGIVLCGLYSDANPAPGDSEDVLRIALGDDASIAYDFAARALDVTLPDGATASIRATGGITFVGDLTVDGTIRAKDDVLAGEISLRDHRHDKVQAGAAISGKPVA